MRFCHSLLAAVFFATALLATPPAIAQSTDVTERTPLNGPVIQRIRERQALTIAYHPNMAPFSLLGDDGQPTGYTVDLCKIIASQLVTQLDLKLMDVRWVKTNTRSRFDVIASGDADLECSATSNTLDRQRHFGFSLTTFIQGATFAVRSDTDLEKLDHLTAKKIAVVRNSTTSKLLKQAVAANQLQATLVEVKSFEAAANLLASKDVDAVAGDRLVMFDQLVRSKLGTRFRLLPQDFAPEYYAVMMAPNDPDFRWAVNATLSRTFRTPVIGELFQRWFGSLNQPGQLMEALYFTQAYPE
ncbi:amino acid ABC transporter substrate-binding protein [Fluviibacter phosphoraccumulans]|uniref:Amino acid ABC transporter substrate-binding protein n=1 Tax=Fluviibacter phosphoraccumulans TaxID=1751046 RepID=A0A679IBW4_9RHOO|nr:amino acid ABC transporter substrate-binding protein [Fluviibacter phosphoraccumulans]BBU69221.1 amino acid ABC transporter substrate-binding protein [Fluviibacter phosphoraccumulans]BBU71624.1 amino acid ABC transporter substrate-binding protein [Fluviibacter phosphoraccumulans]BCA65155.1 amino acid ABC transporter substrate-binding protein [Fluviibacter phosphoraccumulans]